MFNFQINNNTWQIIEINSEELKEMYEKDMQEKTYYVFGVTQKSRHIIYINADMCEEQKVRTLKHELSHCYIWEYGFYNVEDLNEEVICDIISASNEFIYNTAKLYQAMKKFKEKAINENTSN